jgi:ubiquinol-cytochrome c reductase cytochrome c1 subunit
VKTLALALLVGFAAAGQVCAQAEVELEPANNNIDNVASLQRGAKYFVNYCLGCHSAKYVRYNRLAKDLQLTEQQVIDNLMFTGERPFDTMTNSMKTADAARWFGKAPPDATLLARSRGTDYIYTFLHSFYANPARPTGADNLVLPGTAMPDVLWEVQGIQRPVYAADPERPGAEALQKLETIVPGSLDRPEFDQMVRDIVNFLDYISEPIQRERENLGIRVIGFLLVFLLIAYLLKREIWKDVH